MQGVAILGEHNRRFSGAADDAVEETVLCCVVACVVGEGGERAQRVELRIVVGKPACCQRRRLNVVAIVRLARVERQGCGREARNVPARQALEPPAKAAQQRIGTGKGTLLQHDHREPRFRPPSVVHSCRIRVQRPLHVDFGSGRMEAPRASLSRLIEAKV
jgi:hypothetical protein